MPANLPYRGDGSGRPAGLALPPARMPLLSGRRPLKRWTYCGVYGEELMLCAASVRIGGVPQAFWGLLERAGGRLSGVTKFTRGLVAVDDRRLSVHGRGIEIDLALTASGEPIEVVSSHGASYIWTRKQPVHARGRVNVGGRVFDVDAAGLIDASAGYHARVTQWQWSAGAGVASDGRAVCWNLVDGVHDSAVGSERTVWVDGVATEVGPVVFAPGLSGIGFAEDGASLAFTKEAERARRDNAGLVMSDYAQPFGTFAGSLPGGVTVERGFGVMERHDVRW